MIYHTKKNENSGNFDIKLIDIIRYNIINWSYNLDFNKYLCKKYDMLTYTRDSYWDNPER